MNQTRSFRNTFSAITGFTCILLFTAQSHAQTEYPVKWYFSATLANEKVAVITFTAVIENGWYLYSQLTKGNGPFQTVFTFDPSRNYILLGGVKEESTPIGIFDKNIKMNILWFNSTAVFTQRVKLNVNTTMIKGRISFMVANSYQYMHPTQEKFILLVRLPKPKNKS